MSVTPVHVRERRHLTALGYARRYFRRLGLVATVRAIAVTNTALLLMTLHDSEPVCYVSHFRLLLYERLRVSKEFPPHVGRG